MITLFLVDSFQPLYDTDCVTAQESDMSISVESYIYIKPSIFAKHFEGLKYFDLCLDFVRF